MKKRIVFTILAASLSFQASPGSKLQIETDSGDAIRLNGIGTANTHIRMMDDGHERASIYTVDGVSDLNLRGGQQIKFILGSTTEAARIDSAGNVGIGTTSPENKLDVEGVVQAQAFSGGETIIAANLYAIKNMQGSPAPSSIEYLTSGVEITPDGVNYSKLLIPFSIPTQLLGTEQKLKEIEICYQDSEFCGIARIYVSNVARNGQTTNLMFDGDAPEGYDPVCYTVTATTPQSVENGIVVQLWVGVSGWQRIFSVTATLAQ